MAINRFLILLMLFSIILVGCSSSNNPSGQDCVDDNTCNYDSTCDSDVCIAIINVNQNNSIDISMINTVAIAGFQFEITGVNITGVIGGSAIDNSLTVTTGNNIVLGFSFSLATIPVGSDILTQISYTDHNGQLCIINPIFSSAGGAALSVSEGECYN